MDQAHSLAVVVNASGGKAEREGAGRGEVIRMQRPLHFRALPGALKVKVPA